MKGLHKLTSFSMTRVLVKPLVAIPEPDKVVSVATTLAAAPAAAPAAALAVIQEEPPQEPDQPVKPPSAVDVEQYQRHWEGVASKTNATSPISIPALAPADIEYVQSLWRNVSYLPSAPTVCEAGRKQWREVRLFVSSTFTDYFAEREILVKQVIPQLRAWCETRRLTLVDIDLRCLLFHFFPPILHTPLLTQMGRAGGVDH
jgi:hypothetical protein